MCWSSLSPRSPAAPTSAAAPSVRSGQTIELPLALPAAPDTPLQRHSTPVPAAQQRPESVAGDQLELSVASSSPAGPTGADLSPHRPTFSLTAPLRLDAPLRAALGDVVDSFNRDGADVACCSTPTGLFIPLAEFERRAIEPALAMRALADASMLGVFLLFQDEARDAELWWRGQGRHRHSSALHRRIRSCGFSRHSHRRRRQCCSVSMRCPGVEPTRLMPGSRGHSLSCSSSSPWCAPSCRGRLPLDSRFFA